MSVFAVILEGEYDTELKWPFVGSITFTLLNQLKDDYHETAKASFTSKDDMQVEDNWGFDTFIPHSALAHNPVKKTHYLKYDKLFFKVEVAVRKPWLQCHC